MQLPRYLNFSRACWNCVGNVVYWFLLLLMIVFVCVCICAYYFELKCNVICAGVVLATKSVYELLVCVSNCHSNTRYVSLVHVCILVELTSNFHFISYTPSVDNYKRADWEIPHLPLFTELYYPTKTYCPCDSHTIHFFQYYTDNPQFFLRYYISKFRIFSFVYSVLFFIFF